MAQTRSLILRCPPEVRTEIFKNADIEDIPSLVLSHRTLRDDYNKSKLLIHQAIVRRVIDPTVLPLAFARYWAVNTHWGVNTHWCHGVSDNTLESDRRYARKVKKFVGLLINPATAMPIPLASFTYDMALELVRIHEFVTSLQKGFILHDESLEARFFEQHRALRPTLGQQREYTLSEISRIQQSVYLVDIVQHISESQDPDVLYLRSSHGPPYGNMHLHFWKHLPPWQTELTRQVGWFVVELACRFPDPNLIQSEDSGLMSVEDRFFWFNMFKGLQALQKNLRGLEISQSWKDGQKRSSPYTGLKDTQLFCSTGPNRKSLNIQHLVNRFPESDSGPRDHWFYFMATMYTGRKIFHENDPYTTVYSLEHRRAPLALSGLFWDRARLNEVCPYIPTMERMMAVAGDEEIETLD
ncbi:hypothetical protein F4778DRAFT_796869 [Xylariomycetidae sp. FL2044]|nr:hypothetical protein F4778DRAFT_796869 [Xylariomycetidae sp. FL2044]